MPAKNCWHLCFKEILLLNLPLIPQKDFTVEYSFFIQGNKSHFLCEISIGYLCFE